MNFLLRVTAAALIALLLFTAEATARCVNSGLTPLADLRQGLVAAGQPVRVAGIVTGVFLGPDQLGGYFLQENRRSGLPVGLFVYDPQRAPDSVIPGQSVQIQARFHVFHERPQLHRVSNLSQCGRPGLPEPIRVQLPEQANRLPELLGVKVQFPGPLTVISSYSLDRYGSLDLRADGRPPRRGSAVHHSAATAIPSEPGAARHLVLDDGSYKANPTPIPYLDSDGTRRAGDTVSALTGILTDAFDAYRVHPTHPPQFNSGNPRPTPPPPASQDTVRVATFNLENYFLTLGQRGARNRAELDRQRAKLSAAIHALDADIISLAEVENQRAALDDLISQLNRTLPESKHYRAVSHPFTGSDAIKVALIYRPARVTMDAAAVDRARSHQRPPLLAWFTPSIPSNGLRIGVVAVHFKSKTGCPRQGDIDLGQGCWNQRRTDQARDVMRFLDTERRRMPGIPVVIAGDLNAYEQEDPLRALYAAGKFDLLPGHWPEAQHYTYVFHGEPGRLDYLLAGSGIQVQRAGIWHINADEPPFLSYNGRQPSTGPWRASDHDPVWADIKR